MDKETEDKIKESFRKIREDMNYFYEEIKEEVADIDSSDVSDTLEGMAVLTAH